MSNITEMLYFYLENTHLGCFRPSQYCLVTILNKHVKINYIFLILYLLGLTTSLDHDQIGLLWGLNSKFPTSIPVCFIWKFPPGNSLDFRRSFPKQRLVEPSLPSNAAIRLSFPGRSAWPAFQIPYPIYDQNLRFSLP